MSDHFTKCEICDRVYKIKNVKIHNKTKYHTTAEEKLFAENFKVDEKMAIKLGLIQEGADNSNVVYTDYLEGWDKAPDDIKEIIKEIENLHQCQEPATLGTVYKSSTDENKNHIIQCLTCGISMNAKGIKRHEKSKRHMKAKEAKEPQTEPQTA